MFCSRSRTRNLKLAGTGWGEGVIPHKVICDTVGEANGEEDGNETLFEPDAQRRAVVAWFVGHFR